MSSEFIPVSRPEIAEREERYVLDAVRSGWVSSLGPYIDNFEAAFAAYCGTAFAVAVSNGTTGLHLALAAMDIGAGDEVIVPDLTFVATANAVAYTGATPVLADVDADTGCLSAEAVERVITPRTRAIMPVHLYGHPADMDPIRALAEPRGIAVIEDAAEAHGARYKGRRVGGLGAVGVFSFYGNKIITTGEGGMLTLDDRRLYQRARWLRDHAMSPERRYFHPERGFNYRMTNIQAALGLAQLERIDEFLDARARIVQWYRESIASLSPTVRLNHVAEWATNAYWMVCLEVEHFDESSRQRFMQGLRSRGIDSRPYFYPLSTMPMYASPTPSATARKSRIGVNLPTYCALTRDDVRRVGAAVDEVLREIQPG